MSGRFTDLVVLGREPEEVRDAARGVLSDPIFDHEPSLFERAIDRVLAFLGELFDGEALVEALTSEVAGWLVAAVALALLSFAVWRWTRGLRVDAATLPETTDTEGRSAQEWAADARDAEQRGELEVALRYDYLAIVATIEQAGWVEPLPGRTIRELDRELAGRWPDRPEGIERTGRRVEQVVFGGDSAQLEDLRAARAVLAALDRPPAGARS